MLSVCLEDSHCVTTEELAGGFLRERLVTSEVVFIILFRVVHSYISKLTCQGFILFWSAPTSGSVIHHLDASDRSDRLNSFQRFSFSACPSKARLSALLSDTWRLSFQKACSRSFLSFNTVWICLRLYSSCIIWFLYLYFNMNELDKNNQIIVFSSANEREIIIVCGGEVEVRVGERSHSDIPTGSVDPDTSENPDSMYFLLVLTFIWNVRSDWSIL